MPVFVVRAEAGVWGTPEGLPLQAERRTKSVSVSLRVLCALACLCFLTVGAGAQSDTAAKKPAAKKSSGTTTAAAKHSSSGTSAGSKTSSASATKAHAAAHASTTKHSKSTNTTTARNSKSRRLVAKKNAGKKTTARGQQKIDPERAQSIQEALIREHYMTGEPAGTWNQASEDALRRYQADHGWQSKTVPDSRALISLGLGPSHDHLLNPESAMTTGPEVSHSAATNASSQIPISNSAEPGARMNAKPVVPDNSSPAMTADPDAQRPQ